GPQPIKLRIEALMTAGRWDADTNIVLAEAGTVGAFTNRASAPGVTSEFAVASNVMQSGSASLRFTAANASGSARGAWTKVERTFAPPLNLAGREGLDVWVQGDDQGAVLNLQLRCPEHIVAGLGEHYIVV